MKKKKIIAMGITAGALMLLGVFALAALLVSANYTKIYGFPSPPKNGVMDMQGISIKDTFPNAIVAFGEWEFFYNKWIVTDNMTNLQPDCILDLPEHWEGKKTASGEIMKNAAFGSYRLTLTGVDAGAEISLNIRYPAAYRTFVNGVLNSQNGTLSKEKDGGFVNKPGVELRDTALRDIVPYIVSEGETLVIVMEISYNTYGGITVAPWIVDARGYTINLGSKIIDFSSFFTPGIIFAFVIFSFVMHFGSKKSLKNLTFPIFTLLAFVQLLTVPEIWSWIAPYFPSISFTSIFNLCLALFHILPAAFFIHLVLHKIVRLSKWEIVVFGLSAAALMIAFYALWGRENQWMVITLLCGLYAFVFYKLALAALEKRPHALFYLLMLFPLITILTLVPFDFFGVIVYPLYPGFSWMLFLIAAAFSAQSYGIIRGQAKQLIKAADLERQNAVLEREMGQVKQQALQAQIKPHFIFNALSSIQALYEVDKRAGSNSLDMFASHLRQNVDSGINDTITFDQEILNIQNYVELENLRVERKLTLLFDIEYTDFELPALSLQPFIENSIKYAGTQDKDDGYMLVESKRVDKEIIIRVSDNGSGFDTGAVRASGVGIKNCTERLKLILDAKTEINSGLNKGTIVTIRIPIKEDAQ